MTTGEIISLVLTAGMFLVSCYMAFARRSQQRQVTMDPGLATKEAFDRHTAWNAAEHEKMWRRMDENASVAANSASMRSDKLYSRIEAVEAKINEHLVEMNKELGALSAETKQQSRLLLRMKGPDE